MAVINEVAAVLVGLLIRFGIPIGLTVLLVWALSKLDAHWRAEAEARKVRTSALGADVRQVRCWETRDCAPEQRQDCPAYHEPELPCWQVFRVRDGRLQEACFGCGVFREAPVVQTH